MGYVLDLILNHDIILIIMVINMIYLYFKSFFKNHSTFSEASNNQPILLNQIHLNRLLMV